jgi:tetratricopeptide (TPR) repeat protein
VWQALREELHPKGLEIVSVGLDTLGAEGCRPFIEAAAPTHPSLIDAHHVLARAFGVINIPSSVWIDENRVIVRPAEAAPAPPNDREGPAMDLPEELPQRFAEMFGEAMKIQSNPAAYHAALRDWVEKGAESEFALTPEEVIARSRPRSADTALGHAHFELATALEQAGDHAAAIEHFRKAHALVPDSWTFRRQAWSLEPGGDTPMARFWQGPSNENPEAWPYEGDWLTDVKKEGAENYSEPWRP